MFPVPGKTLQSNIRRVLGVLQAFSAELGGTTIVASWKPRNVRVTGVFARPWTVLQPFLDGDVPFSHFRESDRQLLPHPRHLQGNQRG